MRSPRHVFIMALFGLAVVIGTGEALAQQDRPLFPLSLQDSDARFRLYETKNIWNFILLDSSTGRAWQVQFSVDEAPEGKWVINEHRLVPEGADLSPGRFALFPTRNMYNFLLLDQEDGRMWQIQWSTDANSRGIISALLPLDSKEPKR